MSTFDHMEQSYQELCRNGFRKRLKIKNEHFKCAEWEIQLTIDTHMAYSVLDWHIKKLSFQILNSVCIGVGAEVCVCVSYIVYNTNSLINS